MAAGPADAFSTTPRGFGCYDRELISAAADNLWSSSVVATASTGASWVDDVDVGIPNHSHHSQQQQQQQQQQCVVPTHHPIQQQSTNNQQLGQAESLEKRVETLTRKFHRGRQLQIKHLPREVTEEEIRDVLRDWNVQSVAVQAGSARVALCSSELLEDWDRNAVFTIRGQRVTIVPSPTEMLLCVGRLPINYTEQQFTALVSTYGETKRSFLMISERTGDSKGYGFVEYVTKEAALQAKNALDGKQLLDFTAVCDWLDSSHITLRSLHSKCLYVDQLPPNYRNMGEFRRIFSTVVNPPYCQIALRNGCPQDWGLVEFLKEDDAERTQQSLNGYVLHGHRIRVAYYIPGVRAINLYLKLLNDGGNNKGRSALLPDPPAPAVFQQLQSLAKQNPVFAQNLQSIILQQIQDMQKSKGSIGNSDQAGNKRHPFQKGQGNQFSHNFNNTNSSVLKNAQQTALTLLLATQQMQQNGGPESPNSGNGPLSPNTALQNQQLLSALQAVSKGDPHFLNSTIPGLNNGSNSLSSLLGLASPNGGLSMNGSMNPLIESNPSQNIPQGFYPNSMVNLNNMHMNNGIAKDEQWPNYNKPQRNNSFGGGNGFHKGPLLPNPSTSPLLDVPMDTNTPKTPPSDPLQAVWYSLFGHSSPPDMDGTLSGSASPLFMKGSSSSNSSIPSPIGRSASENMFGLHHQKSTPPGFSAPNGYLQGRVNSTGDLQEALNTLLCNPQNLTHLLSGNQCNGSMSPPPQFLHSQNQRPNPFGDSPVGMSNALLDLLMHSMRNEQHQQHQQQPVQQDGFGRNNWSSGMSTPPSPIGNTRQYPTGGHSHQPQRSGSNGSSEMSGSSPRSPNYSPFSRNGTNKVPESGNGNASPTPTPWNNSVLGSPPHSHSGFGGSSNFQNRIWAPSISPGNGNLHNQNLLNHLGQKRKVHHESMSEGEFIPTNSSPSSSSNHSLQSGNGISPALASHYADSYFKKKKKN